SAQAPSGPAAGARDPVAGRRTPSWLERRTAGAKVDLASSELVLLMLLFASGMTALVFAVAGHAHPITGLVAAAIGATVPFLWLRWREGAIASRFAEQLPDTVTMLANGVRAGLTLKQAVAQLVRDAPEPTAGELRPVERPLALAAIMVVAGFVLMRAMAAVDV